VHTESFVVRTRSPTVPRSRDQGARRARRGHRVVHTDHGDYSEDVSSPDGRGSDRLWREDKIEELLDEHLAAWIVLARAP